MKRCIAVLVLALTCSVTLNVVLYIEYMRAATLALEYGSRLLHERRENGEFVDRMSATLRRGK